MMLLEAQLEKQSDHQGAMEELEQVHELLRATTQKKTIFTSPPHNQQEHVLVQTHENANYLQIKFDIWQQSQLL